MRSVIDTPPPTPVEPITEVLHGVKIVEFKPSRENTEPRSTSVFAKSEIPVQN